jgi:dTDP-4-dehydrorhamnose reductase
MKILITGAGGMVGSVLTAQLADSHQIIALRHADLDITNREEVFRQTKHHHPDLIINCAVFGVDASEDDPDKARAINVTGPALLAEAAAEMGAEIVHYSTNYVFDGLMAPGNFYTQSDITNPVNVYGQTKLDGEIAVRERAPRSYIIRTSWVYGAGGKNFLTLAPQWLKNRERFSAVTDVYASVTNVHDLIARTQEIIRRQHYDIYQVVNAGVCSYSEYALTVAEMLGIRSDEAEQIMDFVTEAKMKRKAVRPPYSPMRCQVSDRLGLAPLREWQSALADFLKGI